MDNTVLNRVLESQKTKTDDSREEGLHVLNQTQEKCDLVTSLDKLLSLLISVLHDPHAVLNLWRK